MKSTLILALSLCAALGIAAQTPVDQDDVIRVETDVTNLLLTATDKQHRFITTLRAEDIRVLEDGTAQQLFTFQRIPFTGSAFLEQPLTRDVLSVYRALEHVEVALPNYLGSGRPLSGIPTGPGMKAPPNDGTTAIWDAVALASGEVLATVQARRRAIILLTDGWDTTSRLLRSEAIDRALESETVIYAIGIGDSRQDGVDRDALRALAEHSGGRAFFPKKDTDLKTAFAEIEQELRTQYLIAYSSSNKNRDGAYRQLRIEIVNPDLRKEDLKLRYRPGYFAKPLRAQNTKP